MPKYVGPAKSLAGRDFGFASWGSTASPIFTAVQEGAYVVGVAGGSGSGKTSLVRSLCDRMPKGMVCVVSQDDYYHPQEMQAIDANGKVNYDLPTAVDLKALTADLRSLVHGTSIFRNEYTFNQEGRVPGLIELRPAPIILVEGLFLFHHGPLCDLFDLRVFIEASEEVQLHRLLRDGRERGYGREEVLYQWEHHVLPAYRAFLLPYRHQCDLHVVNEESFTRASRVLQDHLRSIALTAASPALQSV